MEKVNPFVFLDAINQTKENLFDKGYEEKDYKPYLINNSLSYHQDTVHLVQFLNEHPRIPIKCQFRFLLNTVYKRKRYSKWFKPEKSNDINLIQKVYNLSYERAEEALRALTEEDLIELRQAYNIEGNND